MTAAADLGRFFSMRDMPDAMKVAGTLSMASSFVVPCYLERRRACRARQVPVILYRMMGMTFRLFPDRKREDVRVGEELLGMLRTVRRDDRSAFPVLHGRLRTECGADLNMREAESLATSYRRSLDMPQDVSERRIARALDAVFGRGRYDLDEVLEKVSEEAARRHGTRIWSEAAAAA